MLPRPGSPCRASREASLPRARASRRGLRDASPGTRPLARPAAARHEAAMRTDVLVLGSGSAGLVAALTAARRGLSVTVLEKTGRLGGTTAMSGAGTWVPANHHAAAAGIADSAEEALAYIRAAAP
ncbi:MAG: FAD-dependent oxidoreductase, partial [Acetobacteraceae bacterium]